MNSFRVIYVSVLLCALGIYGNDITVEPIETTWRFANHICESSGYILLPGRSYRKADLISSLAVGQAVWMKGWRMVSEKQPDTNGDIRFLKTDFIPSFNVMIKRYICEYDNHTFTVVKVPARSQTDQLKAEDSCQTKKGHLARIGRDDVKSVLDLIEDKVPYWSQAVTSGDSIAKQCLAARRTRSGLKYFYENCETNLPFICLRDEKTSLIFAPVVSKRFASFSEFEAEIAKIASRTTTSTTEETTLPTTALDITVPSTTEHPTTEETTAFYTEAVNFLSTFREASLTTLQPPAANVSSRTTKTLTTEETTLPTTALDITVPSTTEHPTTEETTAFYTEAVNFLSTFREASLTTLQSPAANVSSRTTKTLTTEESKLPTKVPYTTGSSNSEPLTAGATSLSHTEAVTSLFTANSGASFTKDGTLQPPTANVSISPLNDSITSVMKDEFTPSYYNMISQQSIFEQNKGMQSLSGSQHTSGDKSTSLSTLSVDISLATDALETYDITSVILTSDVSGQILTNWPLHKTSVSDFRNNVLTSTESSAFDSALSIYDTALSSAVNVAVLPTETTFLFHSSSGMEMPLSTMASKTFQKSMSHYHQVPIYSLPELSPYILRDSITPTKTTIVYSSVNSFQTDDNDYSDIGAFETTSASANADLSEYMDYGEVDTPENVLPVLSKYKPDSDTLHSSRTSRVVLYSAKRSSKYLSEDLKNNEHISSASIKPSQIKDMLKSADYELSVTQSVKQVSSHIQTDHPVETSFSLQSSRGKFHYATPASVFKERMKQTVDNTDIYYIDRFDYDYSTEDPVLSETNIAVSNPSAQLPSPAQKINDSNRYTNNSYIHTSSGNKHLNMSASVHSALAPILSGKFNTNRSATINNTFVEISSRTVNITPTTTVDIIMTQKIDTVDLESINRSSKNPRHEVLSTPMWIAIGVIAVATILSLVIAFLLYKRRSKQKKIESMQENGAQFALVSKSDRGAQNEGFTPAYSKKHTSDQKYSKETNGVFVDEAYDL